MNSEIFVLYLAADRREMETERGRKEWRGRRKEWHGRRKKPAKISLRNGSTNACALFQFLLDGEVTKRHFSDSLGALPSISQHNRLLNPCLSEGTLVPERRHRRPIYCDGGSNSFLMTESMFNPLVLLPPSQFTSPTRISRLPILSP